MGQAQEQSSRRHDRLTDGGTRNSSVNRVGVMTEDTMGKDNNEIPSEKDPGTPMPGAWDKVDRERVCKQTSCGYKRGTGAEKSKPDCKGPRVSQ